MLSGEADFSVGTGGLEAWMSVHVDGFRGPLRQE